MTHAPRVSILMPVRDGAYLDAALETLLAQTFADFEMVVVDDASDAVTKRAIEDRAARDARVRIVRRERSTGLADALNEGLSACRADLIARADGDDVYHPDRLSRQVAAFDARPGLAALSCGWRRIDAHGRRLFTHRPVTGSANLRFAIMFGAPLLHPGAMYRAAAVRTVGGYDPAFWTAQDSDLWARMAEFMELDNLTQTLVDWRQHDETVSRRRGAAGRALGLSVAIRQQTAYLGCSLRDDDVAAGVATYASAEQMPLADLDRGQRHLGRLHACAITKEQPEVVHWFSRHVARALMRQSRWALKDRRFRDSMALLRSSKRWGARSGTATVPQDVLVGRALS